MGERRSTLILLGSLDPTHPDLTILLTRALVVFPTGLGRRRKREKEGQKPGESEFCFNLKKTLVSTSEYPCSRLRLLPHPSE